MRKFYKQITKQIPHPRARILAIDAPPELLATLSSHPGEVIAVPTLSAGLPKAHYIVAFGALEFSQIKALLIDGGRFYLVLPRESAHQYRDTRSSIQNHFPHAQVRVRRGKLMTAEWSTVDRSADRRIRWFDWLEIFP